jgi:hypothetical protein
MKYFLLRSYGFIAPKTFFLLKVALNTIIQIQNIQIIWVSNHSILTVPDEGYSRNASCALNLISKFLYMQDISLSTESSYIMVDWHDHIFHSRGAVFLFFLLPHFIEQVINGKL